MLYENADSGRLAIRNGLKFLQKVPETLGYNFAEEVSGWGRLLPGVSGLTSCWSQQLKISIQSHIWASLVLTGLEASGSPLWVYVGPS